MNFVEYSIHIDCLRTPITLNQDHFLAECESPNLKTFTMNSEVSYGFKKTFSFSQSMNSEVSYDGCETCDIEAIVCVCVCVSLLIGFSCHLYYF